MCSITVALSFITSTSARLNETTASGSYPAFRTSVRIVILSIRRDGFPALSTHTTSHGRQSVRRDEERRRLRDSAFHARQNRGIPAGNAEGRNDRSHPWCGCPVFVPSASPVRATTRSG